MTLTTNNSPPHCTLRTTNSHAARNNYCFLPRECINFASVIQICKFALSGESKNYLGRELKS